MRKTLLKALGLTMSLGLFSTAALADVIAGTYETDDAAGNCGGGDHGLWTNDHTGGGTCSNYFHVDDLTLTLAGVDAAMTGTLIGWVSNPQGINAYINISFSGWSDGIASGYKGGGGAYNEDEQDFFSTLFGTIWIDDNGDGVQDASEVHYVAHMAGTFVQIGIGANDKNSGFGFSTWLTVMDYLENPLSHWDINLNLVSVPEPATLALFGLGLMGAGVARRRRKT